MITGFQLVDEITPPALPILFPGKEAESSRPHLLTVEGSALLIEHEDPCLNQYGEVDCDVRYAEDWYGADHFLSADHMVDGEYWVTVEWVTTHYGYWDPPELDAELVLLYPEEIE
ncbi:hypothetical protein [Streptomyces asiaticus]|uniref:hypothetical protein n=1 Tax=Streptomyces asiaticus TaxID=114695 RepID=UPI003F671658